MAATELGRWGQWIIRSNVVSCNAGATTALVAAVTGKRISLIALLGTADVAGTIALKSSTTAISGTMPVGPYGGFVIPECHPLNNEGLGWYHTAAGEALNLTTVTCTFNGMIKYGVEI